MKPTVFFLILVSLVVGVLLISNQSSAAVSCVCTNNAGGSILKECVSDCSLSSCNFPVGTEGMNCVPATSSTEAPAASGTEAPGVSGTEVGDIPEATTNLFNPLTGDASNKEIPLIIKDIITFLLGLTGVLALIAFIYGGGLWLISAGNEDLIKKGRTSMLWAVIGIAVVFSSYAVLTLIFEILGIK